MGYAEVGQFYYVVSNAAMAIGLLSCGIAMIAGFIRGSQYRTLTLLFAGFFSAAGASRLIKAIDLRYVPSVAEVAIDTIAALFALLSGVVVWLVYRRSMTIPTYDQIQRNVDALNDHKALFDAFLENSPAASFLEDDKAQLLYVNKAFEKSLGVRREEVIGKPSSLWAAEEIRDEILSHNQEVRRTGLPVVRTILFPPKETAGEMEPWLVVRFPVQHNGAGLVGAVGLNLAQQHRQDIANSKLAAIVESSQDAIIGKDLNGIVRSWNRGAEQLYGYRPEEIIGKPISTLVPSARSNEWLEITDKIRRGIRIDDYHTVRVSKAGDLKDVSVSVAPIRDTNQQIIGAAVIARDISHLKRQEDEINQLNKQLKDRVYELAEANAALQAARDQALEASNLKSAFVANISHELRTPLSGILGLNEILMQSGELQGDELRLATMVQQSAEALLQVVNDILDLSKIEAGKITLEYAPFNPVFLLQDATRLMAPTAHQKHLEYHLEIDQRIPDMVYGDVSRLRQVLLNLIGNAIKFTEKGSVRVIAKVLQMNEDDATIEFSVKDTGIGIAAEDQRFLFRPFSQVDNSSTRRFGGTGLGLAISKQFVDMMEGKISVQSEKGTGSTFSAVINFDRKKLHEAQDFATEKMTKPGVDPVPAEIAAGRSVLVVEDNSVLQTLALRQLASLGVDAHATVFGRDAIQMAMSGKFDLILMDINLPDMSGLEVTAAIRDLERSARRPHIPIIAMTAGAMKGDRERAVASGMNDYLAKPVPIEALKRCVELWLKKSQVRAYLFPLSEQQNSRSA
jgi:PAS domain S-box-containing protein